MLVGLPTRQPVVALPVGQSLLESHGELVAELDYFWRARYPGWSVGWPDGVQGSECEHVFLSRSLLLVVCCFAVASLQCLAAAIGDLVALLPHFRHNSLSWLHGLLHFKSL